MHKIVPPIQAYRAIPQGEANHFGLRDSNLPPLIAQ